MTKEKEEDIGDSFLLEDNLVSQTSDNTKRLADVENPNKRQAKLDHGNPVPQEMLHNRDTEDYDEAAEDEDETRIDTASKSDIDLFEAMPGRGPMSGICRIIGTSVGAFPDAERQTPSFGKTTFCTICKMF